jgi:hypothetical protein
MQQMELKRFAIGRCSDGRIAINIDGDGFSLSVDDAIQFGCEILRAAGCQLDFWRAGPNSDVKRRL